MYFRRIGYRLMERSQFNMYLLLDSEEKREICVGLRRMLRCCFRLSCWLEQFPDILCVKTKFSLLQNHPSSQLELEEGKEDDLLGGGWGTASSASSRPLWSGSETS